MKIALIGDIAFFGKNDISKNKSLFQYFSKVSQLLNTFDYVIGNLETPLTTNQKSHGNKSAYISAHPDNVKLLKFLNINYVNLANNHIFDYGKTGYEDTKKILLDNNIKYFGIENITVYINDSEGKVALTGFCCYSTNPVGIFKNSDYGINILEYNKTKSEIEKNDKNGYFNIVSIHAGQEHVNYPNFDHVRLARKLADSTPYLFYGHHPHVLQGIEKYNNSVLAYSLGNFCFDDVYTKKSKTPLISQTENNKSSIILSIEIQENQIVDVKSIGIYADKNDFIIDYKPAENNVNVYSEKLQLPEDEYIKMRNELLNKYLDSRKKRRDFSWYLKRLNINSFLMIRAALKNKKKFQKLILDQLKA